MLSSHSALQILVSMIEVASMSIFASSAIIDEIDHAFVEGSFIIGGEHVMTEIFMNTIFVPKFSIIERIVSVSKSTFTSVEF